MAAEAEHVSRQALTAHLFERQQRPPFLHAEMAAPKLITSCGKKADLIKEHCLCMCLVLRDGSIEADHVRR
eukprot:10882549-Karenia_brevis.AAC.1